ncbi:MAG: TIGR03663 family protein, partial [Anaerolineae bacterium]|nr:TIGR03663 family protein [Anaerolineae bacterium]
MKAEHSFCDAFLDKPLSTLIKIDREKALYILLIILALATRLWRLGDRVQSHDESIHTLYSWNLYTGRGFAHSPMMHGPYLFHTTALSYFLFSDNDFTARLPVALMGTAIVAFPYLLRRWLGRTGALAASFFFLISPSIAYYSRYIRHDIELILWVLVVFWAIFAYLQDGRARWLYVMAAGVSLAFATMEAAYIYFAIFGFFLVGLVAYQWLSDRTHRELSWEALRKLRSFDLTIMLGTLCLPLLSAGPIKVLGLNPLEYSPPTIYYSAAIMLVMLALSVAIGLAWDWRRWTIAAAIFYAIFVVLFTTVFTNGTGLATGLVGALGYWLEQHGVERGSQPEYYYFVMVFFYEYLSFLLTLLTVAYLALRALVARRSQVPGVHKETTPSIKSLFLIFLLWWSALSWFGYSYAGERMPWLTVHIALPMIMTSGWLVGQLIDGTDWQQVRERRGWLLSLCAVPWVVALVMFISALRAGPFGGSDLAHLNITGWFLNGLIGVVGFGAALAYLAYRSGVHVTARVLIFTALLVPIFITIRTTWRFCYVTYDYPIEFLVYAHGAPAVNEAMRQIDELSRRVMGAPKRIRVAYGADGSTLFYWQLRDYPNAAYYGEHPSREQMEYDVIIAGREQWEEVAPYLERDYVYNTYTYLWWPMEDYRNLTFQRIWYAITDDKMRAAIWDIWYNRDYRRYDELTGQSHTLDKWPLRADFRLYIRRDLLAKMWERGTVKPEEISVPVDPYAEGWRDLAARLVFGEPGSEPGQLIRPTGIKVGPDGFVYVADTGNHRIQKFTQSGQFVAVIGRHSPADTEAGTPQGFQEPWDVAVAPDGTIYVADTWNHRIQQLDSAGNVVAAWGSYGPPETTGFIAFYGPRGLAIGPDGNLYVTDTGNKRVQVFAPGGRFVFGWG